MIGHEMQTEIQKKRQVAIWKNVNERFPGFTWEVSEIFWRLIDKDGRDHKTENFCKVLRIELEHGIDIRDRTRDNHLSSPYDAGEQTLVELTEWILNVFEYHSFIEEILDGDAIVPFFDPEPLRLEQDNGKLKKQNSDLQKEIEIFKSQNRTVDDLDGKHLISIYKLIIGLNDGFNNKEQRSKYPAIIEKRLHDPYKLTNETILKILRNAYKHLEENDIIQK